jgi:hypothetical protein
MGRSLTTIRAWGTMGAPNANSRFAKWWSKVEGLAIGKGLLDNVGDAYRYLMNTYSDGDNIFIFGFSRGAYTARAVASILHVYGLLEPGNEQLIPYILRMYAQKSKAAQEATIPAEDAFKYAFSRGRWEVHFCGVWDTVSSYGWLTSPINLRFNGQNPIIRTGRHAVSIHEHRCFYQDSLWGPSLAATSEGPQQDIRQVWFGGVHSDVGGAMTRARRGCRRSPLSGCWWRRGSRDCWWMTSARKLCWRGEAATGFARVREAGSEGDAACVAHVVVVDFGMHSTDAEWALECAAGAVVAADS